MNPPGATDEREENSARNSLDPRGLCQRPAVAGWPGSRVMPLGDRALVVELAGRVSEDALRAVRRVCERLASPVLPGVVELVPGATTVTVVYSVAELVAAGAPAENLTEWLAARVHERLASPGGGGWVDGGRLVEVPVWYGGEAGPDLAAVAARVGLTEDEVIRRHAGAGYVVMQLGFTPGFPYLYGLPGELALPRLATPRVRVAAGSVAIANGQCGIYPVASPGGWHVIGRTPLRMFDPSWVPPARLQAGDRVRFRVISADECQRWEEAR